MTTEAQDQSESEAVSREDDPWEDLPGAPPSHAFRVQSPAPGANGSAASPAIAYEPSRGRMAWIMCRLTQLVRLLDFCRSDGHNKSFPNEEVGQRAARLLFDLERLLNPACLAWSDPGRRLRVGGWDLATDADQEMAGIGLAYYWNAHNEILRSSKFRSMAGIDLFEAWLNSETSDDGTGAPDWKGHVSILREEQEAVCKALSMLPQSLPPPDPADFPARPAAMRPERSETERRTYHWQSKGGTLMYGTRYLVNNQTPIPSNAHMVRAVLDRFQDKGWPERLDVTDLKYKGRKGETALASTDGGLGKAVGDLNDPFKNREVHELISFSPCTENGRRFIVCNPIASPAQSDSPGSPNLPGGSPTCSQVE